MWIHQPLRVAGKWKFCVCNGIYFLLVVCSQLCPFRLSVCVCFHLLRRLLSSYIYPRRSIRVRLEFARIIPHRKCKYSQSCIIAHIIRIHNREVIITRAKRLYDVVESSSEFLRATRKWRRRRRWWASALCVCANVHSLDLTRRKSKIEEKGRVRFGSRYAWL